MQPVIGPVTIRAQRGNETIAEASFAPAAHREITIASTGPADLVIPGLELPDPFVLVRYSPPIPEVRWPFGGGIAREAQPAQWSCYLPAQAKFAALEDGRSLNLQEVVELADEAVRTTEYGRCIPIEPNYFPMLKIGEIVIGTYLTPPA